MDGVRHLGKAVLNLFVFSIPMTVSLFAELLTAVTDTFLAGHLGSQSANALAAMSFAAPVMGFSWRRSRCSLFRSELWLLDALGIENEGTLVFSLRRRCALEFRGCCLRFSP